jgi:pimeloyl-ACP methyl ester carboxylesterase
MTSTTTPQSADQTSALNRGFDGFEIRAANRDGISLGYRSAGDGPSVVLIHGYPQTGYCWHTVAANLAADHRVIVPDYRGAAGSDVPETGYDKETMAHDLAAVLVDADAGPVHVVGHDIGMMIGYAYARLFPASTRTLTMLDAILPGVPSFRTLIGASGLWHFGFNTQTQLAAALVNGRERTYFDWYFDNFCANPSVISDEDREFYAAAARRPGALVSQFQLYATSVAEDVEANERALAAAGKLTVPVFGISGAYSLGVNIGNVIDEVASDTRVLSVEGAGHYLAEEQPDLIARTLRAFFAEHST